MKKRLFLATIAVTLSTPLSGSAQAVTQSLKGLFEITKTNILATAEMLDQELYAFRPTADVRSMGEVLAHVAGAQFAFCSGAAGEPNPESENFQETRTTKADIVEALEMGFGYCDDVFENTTDTRGASEVTFFGSPNTVFGILAFNSAHNYEHYGNLVTYMRLNGIVPPSSMR